MPCRVVACNAENRNTDHGYEAREGNPIHKEGKIRIRKQVGGVGFVIATRVDKRGVYCNTVGIWKSGSEDVQRDVSGRPPRGGAGFQEAIELRATPSSCLSSMGKTLNPISKQTSLPQIL